MEFIKINEVVEKFDGDWSYLSFKLLQIKNELNRTKFSETKIIENFIKSKYHYWNGETEPNGLIIVNIQNYDKKNLNNTARGIKFCGQFDNAKINTENYRRINFEEFKYTLNSTLESNYPAEFLTELKPKLEYIVNQNCNQNDKFYLLDLTVETDIEKISKYHVFSFFVRFLALTEENKSIKVIELGAD